MGAPEPPLHDRSDRALSFGEDALRYDESRPPYPDALVDYLIGNGKPSVLDVGCGTGIASRPLVARGCRLLGVEPDARMATVAADSGIEVEVARFEDWDAAGRRFDLVCAAQAWHWIEPVRGVAKSAEVLTPGGMIAIFWNVGQPDAEVKEVLDACYQRVAADLKEDSVLRGDGSSRVATTCAAIEHDGHFSSVERTTFAHIVPYTTAQWLALLSTHSDHRTLDPAVRAALFAEIAAALDPRGARIDLTYETVCVSARLISRADNARRDRCSVR